MPLVSGHPQDHSGTQNMEHTRKKTKNLKKTKQTNKKTKQGEAKGHIFVVVSQCWMCVGVDVAELRLNTANVRGEMKS